MNHYTMMIISFFTAIFLTLLPLPAAWVWYRPALVAMTVLYWLIATPGAFGLGTAWLIGLLQDGLTGSTLGEHALAMVVIAAITIRLQRQLKMGTVWQQAMVVALFIFIYQTIIMILQGLTVHSQSLNLFWIPALTSGLCWPLMYLLLHGRYRMPYQGYGSHRV